MDYKYIEQLLERYWQCETSLAEEEILRAFFSQDNVSQHLSQYAPLFAGSRAQRQVAALGDDFDSRILAMTEERPAPVKARTVTLRSRFMPLFKAGCDPVYVGRIRSDISNPNGLTFWTVSDQIKKGAALNAVQIAEYLLAHKP